MQYDRLEDYRSPSPWDRFRASPSPGDPSLDIQLRAGDGIPKLVPEVEQVRPKRLRISRRTWAEFTSQGNVEYKLKLINPTPERCITSSLSVVIPGT